MIHNVERQRKMVRLRFHSLNGVVASVGAWWMMYYENDCCSAFPPLLAVLSSVTLFGHNVALIREDVNEKLNRKSSA